MPHKLLAVTGATGFIGSHLVPRLLADGYKVIALSRRPLEYKKRGLDVRRADLLEYSSLEPALEGVQTAFYLVHSMRMGSDYADLDRIAAINFLHAADNVGVERIIYLGGLGEIGDDLSAHLKSRGEVGRILQSGEVAATVLRAAIIIGPGGGSWEALRQLVERLPFMIAPRWIDTPCQPIALRDVLGYLVGCVDVADTMKGTFDIGGPDVLTYRQMMLILEEALGLKRQIVGIPVLTPQLSSYWLELVSDVPSSVVRPLIEGLRNEVVCREDRIRSLVKQRLTPYREAVELALRGEV